MEVCEPRSDSQNQIIKAEIIYEIMALIGDLRQELTDRSTISHRQLMQEQQKIRQQLQILKQIMAEGQDTLEQQKLPLGVLYLTAELSKLGDAQKMMEIKINSLQQQLHLSKSDQKQIIKPSIVVEEVVSSDPIVDLSIIVDPKSKYRQDFRIGTDRVVQKIALSSTQLLGNIPIMKKPINQFTLLKTRQKQIWLGIISREYICDRNSYFTRRKQFILYNVKDGNICLSGNWIKFPHQSSSSEKEKVTMIVEGQTITWKVGYQRRNQLKHPLISDSSIKWVPFITLVNLGDKVKWE